MRYTIEGFSQIEALKFRRTEIVKRKNPKTGVYEDKETVVTLDCTDLVILRWFVDFWPRMMKVDVNGRQYAWLSYKSLIEDMPLIGIKKRALAARLNKLVDFGILCHKTVKNGGTFSYYGFGPEYVRLVDSSSASNARNDMGGQSNDEGVVSETTTPMQQNDVQIDSSTKYPSTKEPEERKKEDGRLFEISEDEKRRGEIESFNAIIDGFTTYEPLREALREFLKYRVASSKLSKKAFTNDAMKKNLTKLLSLTQDQDEMVGIVNQTIASGWSGFFKLRDDSEPPMSKKQHLKRDKLKKRFEQYDFDASRPKQQQLDVQETEVQHYEGDEYGDINF